MKFSTLFAFLLPCIAACVQMTVSDDVSVDDSFSYELPTLPTLPPGTPIPPYSQTFTQSKEEDVSDVISKLNDVGTTSFTVNASTVTASMPIPFVTHITVDILEKGGGDLVVVDTDTDGSSGTTFNLPVLASSSDLLSYLGSGQVTISVSLTMSTVGLTTTIPTGTLTLDYMLGLNASVSVSK